MTQPSSNRPWEALRAPRWTLGNLEHTGGPGLLPKASALYFSRRIRHHREASRLIRLRNRLACVGIDSFPLAPLVVSGMPPEVEVLSAIFPPPEEPCQPRERHTEHEVEELKRERGGKGIP